MIRFCDKNVYIIGKDEMSRSQMLSFYLSENGAYRRDVLLVMEENCYYGMATFQRVLKGQNTEECILRETVTASEAFFKEAGEWFRQHPNELLPILDTEKQLCGFCYDDNGEYQQILAWLSIFESLDELPCSFFEFQKDCKQICIVDCNEIAYRFYCLFIKFGYSVRVEGEEWEWFGVFNGESLALRNETFYIYAEGAEYVRWSWTFDEEPPCVKDYFSFFYSWIVYNKKYIYEQLIYQLKKLNISVWCFAMPAQSKIKYRTEQEIKGIYSGVYLHEALFVKNLPKEKRLILEAIMGEAEAEMLCDKKLPIEKGGFKEISYTDITCEILRDEELEEKGRIYLIGPCIVEGSGNFIKNTLPARLQEKVKEQDYVVVRMLFNDGNWPLWSRQGIEKLPLREKDIVLFIDQENDLGRVKDCPYCLNLLPLFNDIKRRTWMVNDSMHLNKEGIAAVAEEIYNKVLEKEIRRIRSSIRTNHFLQKGEILSDALQEKVQKYINKIQRRTFVLREGDIGSIVMNCNPFTYGHQYLIEYAAFKIDKLYVFVVEEERSVFPFELRKQMVEEGTRHLNNVCVVPSGEWVLSYQTFSAYFGKAERQEEKVDARMDLEIFARYIAPPLGITCRFVGEEPTDKITRQYNEQMKKILEEFDICVEEVPRKEFNGKVISASYVRKCIEEKRFEEIGNYVPESTKILLERRFQGEGICAP